MNLSEKTEPVKERAVLIGVHTGNRSLLEDTTEESMIELAQLADTAGAEVLQTMIQNRPSVEASTYVGQGKLEEVREICKSLGANLIIVDDELSGSQIRNLEEATGVRVIDRSTLILDIFAARAFTKEGKIQVELAQLKYMLPRLTGMGSALSRLGGGIGTRGPGETKLETDRRHIWRRIKHLENELKEVRKHRELLRSRRKKQGLPVAALVGYTNAGKSSLMNALSDANVLTEDKLFATLDPTVRGIELPDYGKVLLVDTVGFIRKLPHHLIEAFKSTLEEAVEADVLLHVVDSSSDAAEQHVMVVDKLLDELGASNRPIILVYNKVDKRRNDCSFIWTKDGHATARVEVSAVTGQGLDDLKNTLARVIPEQKRKVKICLRYSAGSILSQIHESCDVLQEQYVEQGIVVEAIVDKTIYGKIKGYIIGDEG